ncbi:response regulator transcription factor [Priestia taiwanensis]|uniref:DNA-binding response regulator n=1 Tax=Priestia taiwanensis TaxID=1347902 RepID=A0A917AJ85_9BACI|nr:response regulator transcription factor [Priestia taiwanensis]MBM7361782.1 DNA-binding response OmpR family regulator [Priestia taiwanensis]GGE56945.1 DNA-binding response regulator [Priestia taiwanensis]
MNLLLVDDEPRMLQLLELYLAPQGYTCTKMNNGKDALDALSKNEFDLVLLDVMMPDMDGWTVCKQIRTFSTIPIIMLTARDGNTDIVKGLTTGADDYISKPFDETILLARIQAILRRTKINQSIQFESIYWNRHQYIVTVHNEPISMTPIEFDILGLFLHNQNQVLSREQLIQKIWGYDSEVEDRTVDSHIRNVRDKLRKSGFSVDDYLKTVYGMGYRWIKKKTENNE